MEKGKIDVVLGVSLGDEAKGKIADYLAKDYRYSARFSGSDNCGAELLVDGKKLVLHMIPAGIAQQNTCIIGNGCLVNPSNLLKEINSLKYAGIENVNNNLIISDRAFITIPCHLIEDARSENLLGSRKIGTTKKGVTPSAISKVARQGIRMGEIFDIDFVTKYNQLKSHFDTESYDDEILDNMEVDFFEAIEYIKDNIKVENTIYTVNDILNEGHSIICNGNQGSGICPELGTTYPYCTSTPTTIGAVCLGLGVSPDKIGKIYGVEKFYTTRVGNGFFMGDLEGTEMGDYLRDKGNEFGSTTGRPRQVSWLNLVSLRYACMINGVTDLCLTKADVLAGLVDFKVINGYINKLGDVTEEVPFNLNSSLYPRIKSFNSWGNLSNCTDYKDFPNTLKDFLKYVEEYVGVSITFISTGKEREKTIKIK